MNLIFYIATTFAVAYCINNAIKMNLKTRRIYTYTLLVFFGVCIASDVYVYYFNARVIDVILMISITSMLYASRRKP